MPTPTLPRRARAALLTLTAGAALTAAAPGVAHADLSSWSSLGGLDAAAGASWVRDYEFSLPGTVYASTEGSGVYRSDNGGLSFRPFNDGLMEIPGSRDVRSVLASGSTALAGTSAGLFKSDGGAWTPLAQEPEPDVRRGRIRLHRAVQKLFEQGNALLAGVQSGGVYVSFDDGATWRPPAPGNGMPAATTVWDLESLIPGIVFAATSDGVYRSADAGTSWTPVSDGISGTVMRIFKDPVNVNIWYAGTTDGVFRSVTLGQTWTSVNGTGRGALGNGVVRALEPFVNGVDTRLYAGTGDGVWVGTTGNGPLPGPVRWRKVTEQGLARGGMPNDVVWALTPHALPIGTLLLGTQSNGGYALTFQPPIPVTAPVILGGDPRVGVRLVATTGTWSGTPSIEYGYQWQRCTSTSTSSCDDIRDATEPTYVPTDEDRLPSAKRLRVVVTAENDFPTGGLVRRASDITAPTVVHPSPDRVPGATQQAAPTISALLPGEAALPQSGDTLMASVGYLNPAPDTRSWTWWSCTASGLACAPVPGATRQTFRLEDEHVGRRLKVTVSGTNDYGTGTTQPSGLTNTIFPGDPRVVSPPSIAGLAQVGETLVGSVGRWQYPGTTYRRRWLRCDDSSCQTIQNQTGAVYVPTGDDLGRTIVLEVTADSNGPSTFPSPVSVQTAPTAAVVPAPLPPVDPPPPPPEQPPAPPTPPIGDGGPGTPPQPQPPLPPQPPRRSDARPRARAKPSARLTLPRRLRVGAKVTAPGRFGGFRHVRYQWLRNGRPIGRATRRGYTLTRADRGQRIVCKVTLTPPRGRAIVVKSRPVKLPRAGARRR